MACMAGGNGAHVQTAAVVGQQEQADTSDAADSSSIAGGGGTAAPQNSTLRRTRRRGVPAAAAASSSTAYGSLVQQSCTLQGPTSTLQGGPLPASARHSSPAGNLQGSSRQGYVAEYLTQDLTDGPDPWLLQPAVPAGLVHSPADGLSDFPSHIAIRLQPNGRSSSSSSSHGNVGSKAGWGASNGSVSSTSSGLQVQQPASVALAPQGTIAEGAVNANEDSASSLGKAITTELLSCQTWHDLLGVLQSVANTPQLVHLPPDEQQQLLQQQRQQQPLQQDARAAGLLAVPQVQQLEAPSLECLNHRNLAVLWLTLARVLPSESSSRQRHAGQHNSRASGGVDAGHQGQGSTGQASAGAEQDTSGNRRQSFQNQVLGRGDVLILQRLLAQLEQRSLVAISEGAWDSRDLANVQWAMASIGHVPSSRCGWAGVCVQQTCLRDKPGSRAEPGVVEQTGAVTGQCSSCQPMHLWVVLSSNWQLMPYCCCCSQVGGYLDRCLPAPGVHHGGPPPQHGNVGPS
jgi:hypothetical protein